MSMLWMSKKEKKKKKKEKESMVSNVPDSWGSLITVRLERSRGRTRWRRRGWLLTWQHTNMHTRTHAHTHSHSSVQTHTGPADRQNRVRDSVSLSVLVYVRLVSVSRASTTRCSVRGFLLLLWFLQGSTVLYRHSRCVTCFYDVSLKWNVFTEAVNCWQEEERDKQSHIEGEHRVKKVSCRVSNRLT